MFRHHNTKSIALNMVLTVLSVGCKYGLRNKLKTFFSIVQSISDSTTANAKMNFFLNICLFLSSLKTVGSMNTIVSRDF